MRPITYGRNSSSLPPLRAQPSTAGDAKTKMSALSLRASKIHSNRSILRRLVHVIDNEDIHWPLCRFKAESELFLKR